MMMRTKQTKCKFSQMPEVVIFAKKSWVSGVLKCWRSTLKIIDKLQSSVLQGGDEGFWCSINFNLASSPT
jgi:hypothetical protein